MWQVCNCCKAWKLFNIDAYFEGSVNASGGLSTLGFHEMLGGMKEFNLESIWNTIKSIDLGHLLDD